MGVLCDSWPFCSGNAELVVETTWLCLLLVVAVAAPIAAVSVCSDAVPHDANTELGRSGGNSGQPASALHDTKRLDLASFPQGRQMDVLRQSDP